MCIYKNIYVYIYIHIYIYVDISISFQQFHIVTWKQLPTPCLTHSPSCALPLCISLLRLPLFSTAADSWWSSRPKNFHGQSTAGRAWLGG